MTKVGVDPSMGRAVAADGGATVIASSVGGSPTTTYAENIGVMAATRVYSTAAYFVAAIVAILLGLVPKFGAIVNATPPAVLGGITLVLYGMIGLVGAKIWKENGVDFGRRVNLVPLAAGIILAIGDASREVSDDFILNGIALGTGGVGGTAPGRPWTRCCGSWPMTCSPTRTSRPVPSGSRTGCWSTRR
jgi:xanthine/uracil permease